MNLAQCTCPSDRDDRLYGLGFRQVAVVLDEKEDGRHYYKCLNCGAEREPKVRKPEAPRVQK